MERFVSLDVLRGLTVIGMILVNTQGEGVKFAFLRHSSWNGCTIADFVYPFFLFIVGAAIRFAFKKSNYELSMVVAQKVLKRGAIIFLIGFLLNIFPFTSDPGYWRIPGVLQRIALVYVLATFTVLWIKSPAKILALTTSILIGYSALIVGTGTILEDNIVLKVDQFLFGESHLYTGYGIPFDPEGLLSSIPAIANALFGYLAAVLLVNEHNRTGIPYRMGVIGVGMILLAFVWNLVLPFNKPLWSSSFVLFTCGWAIFLWFVMFFLIDIKKIKGWTNFFLVFGTNALFTYVLSELLVILNWMFPFEIAAKTYYVSTWLDAFVYSSLTTTPLRAMLWGITMVLVCWGITYPLYKRNIYIKL